jgi:uncharacterized protein YbjQ (UPF0145 family)
MEIVALCCCLGLIAVIFIMTHHESPEQKTAYIAQQKKWAEEKSRSLEEERQRVEQILIEKRERLLENVTLGVTDVLVTTTPSLEGYSIKRYLGIVRVICPAEKTFSDNYTLDDLMRQTLELGGNGVVGVQVTGQGFIGLMGTAVLIEPIPKV